MKNLMTLQEASAWATKHLGKKVTPSNISYLVQYGRVPKNQTNGGALVRRSDLEAYYKKHLKTRQSRWRKKLGDDLNWGLSFSEYTEAETTKHVHRLHPYKGKFIPQLVEYFLDGHTDRFKQEAFFQPGDIVLDPFCGSGTTLVQANESGLHAVGIDVSAFNAFISNAKTGAYDIDDLRNRAEEITAELRAFQQHSNNAVFENRLSAELKAFNDRFFPSPAFKRKVREHLIDEKKYGERKAKQFLPVYFELIKQYGIQLEQDTGDSFLDKWFIKTVRDEIDFIFERIGAVSPLRTKKILALILSRTIRSCRATTHADLGTLKAPVTETYYCKKHGKICKPLFSTLGWWRRYTRDTVNRLDTFARHKTGTSQHCLAGDSRRIDLIGALQKEHSRLGDLVGRHQFSGIFSSPPYVGLINYHEQHAYAYDLFGFERNDESEIGPLYKGQGAAARQSYVQGISDVLNHCKPLLKRDCNIFLVANDKYDLYPSIAKNAGMEIAKKYKRPVLNRMEKDRAAYAESIFHLRQK